MIEDNLVRRDVLLISLGVEKQREAGERRTRELLQRLQGLESLPRSERGEETFQDRTGV